MLSDRIILDMGKFSFLWLYEATLLGVEPKQTIDCEPPMGKGDDDSFLFLLLLLLLLFKLTSIGIGFGRRPNADSLLLSVQKQQKQVLNKVVGQFVLVFSSP